MNAPTARRPLMDRVPCDYNECRNYAEWIVPGRGDDDYLCGSHYEAEQAADSAGPLGCCPCCEGSGKVASASGWTDVACLCSTLDATDRVILRGRAATLAAWEANGESATERDRLRATMAHLVAGCVGPCRGNACAPGTARCAL